MSEKFPIGSFVYIPFGARSTQIAQVVGYGRRSATGAVIIKVRAWNATQGHWMPNPRPVTWTSHIMAADASDLPPPPALNDAGDAP